MIQRLFLGLTLAFCAIAAACTTDDAAKPKEPPIDPGFRIAAHTAPAIPREFRGAWVATVANIDWPSKPGLTAEAMRDEIVANVAQAKAIGINALLLQVRANADAIYPSALEPWADVLTGVQGQTPTWAKPTPGQAPFDPLKTWIDEAHASGIEIHAWFNPYRARHTSARSPSAASHLSRTRPDLVKNYGGFGWLDPGEPDAAAHSLAVVEDVVRRYNVDGVHMDDYFYPYPVNTVTRTVSAGVASTATLKIDFPDEPAWRAFNQGVSTSGGKTMTRADWRRDNVNRFVQQFDARVRAIKPHVQVSISPFGIGKPSLRPEGIRGFSQYDELYADVEHWQAQGWMDFLVPQLYWPIAQKPQAFPVLLHYWASQNPKGVPIYSGLYSSRVNGSTSTWQIAEVAQQIEITRERSVTNPLLNGHVHFSWVALKQNRMGLADATQKQYTPTAALTPASWRAPTSVFAAPQLLRVVDKTLLVQAEVASHKLVLWQQVGGAWQLSTHSARAALPLVDGATAVVVSALDRYGRESARVSADLSPQKR